MNAQQQGTYMMLLMAGRENEALAYRDKCNASGHSRNFAIATGKGFPNRVLQTPLM